MYRLLLLCLTGFSLATAQAASSDWIGKTVVIRTTKDGAQGITIKGDELKLGLLKEADACAFKISAGQKPGDVIFESVGQPNRFLHHRDGQFNLRPKKNGDAQWRIVPPLQGKAGISLESGTVPGKYLTEQEKNRGSWHLTKKVERKRDAVFFLEEWR